MGIKAKLNFTVWKFFKRFKRKLVEIKRIFLYKIKNICIFTLLFTIILWSLPILSIIPFQVIGIVILLGIINMIYKIVQLEYVIALCLSYIIVYVSYYLYYDGIIYELLANEVLSIYTIGVVLLLLFMVSILPEKSAQKSTRPNKKLFEERKKDLRELRRQLKLEDTRIIGIDASWGSGKSLLIDYLVYLDSRKYRFVRLDILALNLDNVLEYLVHQISRVLREESVSNLNARKLAKYFSNVKFGELITALLDLDESYAKLIDDFKTELRKLNKSIIVIFEDLDRIDDIGSLRKIFYISEKLSENVDGKIKFVHQCSLKELKNKGFDFFYLQKYIPNTMKLSNISFMSLVDYIINTSSIKYPHVLQNRYLIEKIVNNSVEVYSYSKKIIDFSSTNRYLEDVYNIRNIEEFIRTLEERFSSFESIIEGNKDFEALIVKWCYIRFFLQDFYNNISTKIPLLFNFKINFDGKSYLMMELINELEAEYQKNNLAKIKQIRNQFSAEVNTLNLEKFIAFCILELYWFNYFISDLNDNIRSNPYFETTQHLQNDPFKKVEILERYFYYCISLGNNINTEDMEYTNAFISHVLNVTTEKRGEAYLDFIDKCYYEHNPVVIPFFLDTWTYTFRTFGFCAINWSEENVEYYFNQLIQLFFECPPLIRGEDSLIDEDILKNLLVFLDVVKQYNIHSAFIFMVKQLNEYIVVRGLRNNNNFIEFEERFISVIQSLEYIKFDYRNDEALSFNQLVSEDRVKFYNKCIEDIRLYIVRLQFNPELKDLFESYIGDLASIQSFLHKLIELNTKPNIDDRPSTLGELPKPNDISRLDLEQFRTAVKAKELSVVNILDWIDQ